MSHSNFGKSPKIKRNKIEFDIEKCRSECRWLRARDLLNALKVERQTVTSGLLQSIVLAEVKLEKIMNESDSISIEEAREIKGYLDEVINGTDDGYKLEAKLLMGKLRYSQRKYKEAVASLEALNLKNIKIEQGQSRLTKLVAEGFAIVGLSLEDMSTEGGTDGGEVANCSKEMIDRILENLDLAGDIGLFHLQELEKSAAAGRGAGGVLFDDGGVGNGMMISSAAECSAIVTKLLSKAIQRSPIVAIQQGRLQVAISRYRQLLRYQETETSKPLRQTLARQLAEVLLRGVCRSNYSRITIAGGSGNDTNYMTNITALSVASLSPSPAAMWRQPLQYPSSGTSGGGTLGTGTNISTNNVYTPTELNQEILLLLLISEYLANQEAVLNRSPEHSEARLSTLHNSQAVYDLLTISLSRLHCYPYLCQLLQHALRFSYKEWHTWYQLGLALVSAKQYYAGYRALLECQRLEDPITKGGPVLLAAGLAIEALGRIDEGLELAKLATSIYGEQGPLVAKSRLLVGRALELIGSYQEALEETLQATKDDPQQSLAFYRLALLHVHFRQLPEALEACGSAVRLDGGQSAAPLHLLALLQSATGRLPEALRVVEAALVEHSTDLGLLRALARIQLTLSGSGGKRAALRAYQQVVEACRDMETAVPSNNPIDNMSNEYTSQEAVLGLTELYLDCGIVQEAQSCIDSLQKTTILPSNQYYLLYLRGRIHEANDKLQEARQCLEQSLAINPTYIAALQRLGRLLQRMKQYELAEKMLRDSLILDPNNSWSWQCLGELFTELCSINQQYQDNTIDVHLSSEDTDIMMILETNADDDSPSLLPNGVSSLSTFNKLTTQEMVDNAAKCLAVAADLELTEPVESFFVLPRAVKYF